MPEKTVREALEELKRKRAEIDTAIRVYEEIIVSDSVSVGLAETVQPSQDLAQAVEGDPASVVYPGMFFGQTQAVATKMLLDKVRRPLRTKAIIDCLAKGGLKVGGKNPSTNLWSVLDRNDETFVLVPKAGWALVEWYAPNVLARMRKEGSETGNEDKNGDDTKSVQ